MRLQPARLPTLPFKLYKLIEKLLDCYGRGSGDTRPTRVEAEWHMVQRSARPTRTFGDASAPSRGPMRGRHLSASRRATSGLTPRQFAVLMTIAEEEGLTQTDLVDRTGIDRSTLADIVARLLGARADPSAPRQGGRQGLCHQAHAAGRKALREAQPGAAAADRSCSPSCRPPSGRSSSTSST